MKTIIKIFSNVLGNKINIQNDINVPKWPLMDEEMKCDRRIQ